MTEIVDIDIWTWHLDARPDRVAQLDAYLSSEERVRAQRFVNPVHGMQYSVGRGTLREILAGYVGSMPQDLHFSIGRAGKPRLSGVASAMHFNLSHTGDFAALAVTSRGELGLDVEAIRDIDLDVARRFFSPSETAALHALPPLQREAAFYRCWTRKEAFIKASGDGFNRALDTFDVTIDDAPEPRLLRLEGRGSHALAAWHFRHLGEDLLAPGIVGALAIETATSDATLRLGFRQP